MSGRLTEGFRDIIELRWSDLVAMEADMSATNFDAIVSSLVRACKKGNLRAIQTALDRLDGKIAMEVEVEYPKFYTVYPNAKLTAGDKDIIDEQMHEAVALIKSGPMPTSATVFEPSGAADLEELDAEQAELPTGSLRIVLEKMLDSPKEIVKNILDSSTSIDSGVHDYGDPLVKSVIIAGLMKLVHDGRMSAVFEVFEQIDGKVADKIKLLGSDMKIVRYDEIAPAGAVKNEDGVYQIEAKNTTDTWAMRLAAARKGNR